MEQQACFDQSDVFTFLADPATHELREPVIRIDTHGAAVFLAGENVYKVKRAVRFPFMDFSTLDKWRRAFEVPINTLTERIAKRKDASDATAEIVSAQAKQPTGAVD
jgi:aminoglycoside phosphotransferase family enzyme